MGLTNKKDMDRYTAAVRRYILIQHEEGGYPLDSKEHLKTVNTLVVVEEL